MLYILGVPKDYFVKVTQGFTGKATSLCHSHVNYMLNFQSLLVTLITKRFNIKKILRCDDMDFVCFV